MIKLEDLGELRWERGKIGFALSTTGKRQF